MTRKASEGTSFQSIAVACYAAYRADARRSTTTEDADKALLDAAYFSEVLARPDLDEYVAGLHDKLGAELANRPGLKMPGEPHVFTKQPAQAAG